MNRKEILRRIFICVALALALCAALYAAYVSGVKSGLNAPGVEVIECPAETPDAGVIGCPTAPPSEADVLARAAAILESGPAPAFEATFMGGSLQAYETDGGMLCVCDPDPGADSHYGYALFGSYEISAEEYYQLHGGPGRFESYDAERKILTWGWGEEYDRATMYKYAVPVFELDAETGSVVWMLTAEEFEIFRAEGAVRLSEASTEFANLAAVFD